MSKAPERLVEGDLHEHFVELIGLVELGVQQGVVGFKELPSHHSVCAALLMSKAQLMVPRKMLPRKMVPKKVVPKKMVPKKLVPKKIIPKKLDPKKMVPKKLVPRKMVPKKLF